MITNISWMWNTNPIIAKIPRDTEKIMPLDPTSPLANNMSKENHDAFFDKFWVAMPHPFRAHQETFTKSFNTVKEVKDYLRPLGEYPYSVFYGKKINITIDRQEDKIKDVNLGNNIDVTG